MCFGGGYGTNINTPIDPNDPRAKRARGWALIGTAIAAGQGNRQAQANLATFRSNFRAAHGGMTAAQLVSQRSALGGTGTTVLGG
jgi:hypothetical protein